MAKLKFDAIGEKRYETGVRNAVLYPKSDTGTYPLGVAWNGIISITDSPSGAEVTPLYADDIKYINLVSAEDYGATVEAYMYPDEFAVCDGTAEIAEGITIAQQPRKPFGLVYKTIVGNDVEKDAYGYKLHILYDALAAPSEKAYSTVNDQPEAITFSWELTTTPVAVTGFRPTAKLTIDSTKVDPEKMELLEAQLYGMDADDTSTPEVSAIVPHLLMPDEIMAIVAQG